MSTYKIVRHYFDKNVAKETVKRGLTLEEAQDHCGDDETSSETCKRPENIERTNCLGPWFDSYTEE